MTVLPDLEKQLISAAERATRGRHRREWRARASAGRIAGGLALGVMAGATVVIAVAAVILLGGHKRSTAVSSAPPGRQQLIDIIGVLRRPQTKADLRLSFLSRLGGLTAFQGHPDLPLIRFATTTPWGEKLFLVPMKPPSAAQLGTVAGPHVPASVVARLRARGETLGVFSSHGGGGAGDAASIEAGYGTEVDGAGRSFAGGSTETRFILVVPDGVAKVEFVLPRQPQPGVAGAPTYQRSSRITAPVHDNVVAVQVDREFDGGAPPMIWYSAGGRVLKRIGNFARVNRVIPPPRPGPETPLSRAAERDPSTPNRVWLTPAVGGPHTKFVLHFRVLLNDADYSYRLSGTRCPEITVSGGSGGGSTDLRGRTWSAVIDAVQGQTWCPGTHKVSATVMDLGRHGALKHPARPFGAATFSVRP